MQSKTCSKCSVEKEITEFYKNKGGKFGVMSICKNCRHEHQQTDNYKQYQKQYRKKYIKTNVAKEIQKKYRQSDSSKKYQKQYRQGDNYKQYQKQYHQTDKCKDARKKYNQKPEIKKRKNKYQNKKYKTNINFKFIRLLRDRTRAFFKDSKFASTVELLGCSYEFGVKWIEAQFTPEMNWENIHIDHIRPLSSFDNLEQEQFKACNWRNLQPLLEQDNLSKSDNWDGTDENLSFSRQALSPEAKRNLIKEYEIKLTKGELK